MKFISVTFSIIFLVIFVSLTVIDIQYILKEDWLKYQISNSGELITLSLLSILSLFVSAAIFIIEILDVDIHMWFRDL